MLDEHQDREILGTKAFSGCGVGSVTLVEGGAFIHLTAKPSFDASQLSPTQARKLARHLNRLARRIEDRNV